MDHKRTIAFEIDVPDPDDRFATDLITSQTPASTPPRACSSAGCLTRNARAAQPWRRDRLAINARRVKAGARLFSACWSPLDHTLTRW
jgi:hypothetical protein